MGKIGIPELLVILVLAFVVFGGGKLAGVGKALGRSIREFKDEVKSDDSTASKSDDQKNA